MDCSGDRAIDLGRLAHVCLTARRAATGLGDQVSRFGGGHDVEIDCSH